MLDIPMLQPASKATRTDGEAQSATTADKSLDKGSQGDFESAYAAEDSSADNAVTATGPESEDPVQPKTSEKRTEKTGEESARVVSADIAKDTGVLSDLDALSDFKEKNEIPTEVLATPIVKKTALSATELAITQSAEKSGMIKVIAPEKMDRVSMSGSQVGDDVISDALKKIVPSSSVKAVETDSVVAPQTKQEKTLNAGIPDQVRFSTKAPEPIPQHIPERSVKSLENAVLPTNISAANGAEVSPRAMRERGARETPPLSETRRPPDTFFQTPRPTAPTAGMVIQPASSGSSPSLSSPDGLELQPLTGNVSETSTQWDPRTAGPSSANPAFARPETATLVGRQMAEALQRLPDKPVELALNPKELGRVKMSIASADGAITVTVLAERPETLDLMRRNIDQLAREFQAIGYDSINFAFSEGQSNEDTNGDSRQDQRSASSDMDTLETPESTPTPIQITPSTGVDIRL